MDRKRSDQGWRAACLAAALFAMTLNFLQPLAHAAQMRSGAPADWTAICLPASDPGSDKDAQGTTPRAVPHACCLGLAHAPVLAAPSSDFVAIERPASTTPPLEVQETVTSVGIRDGPSQPRAPPVSI